MAAQHHIGNGARQITVCQIHMTYTHRKFRRQRTRHLSCRHADFSDPFQSRSREPFCRANTTAYHKAIQHSVFGIGNRPFHLADPPAAANHRHTGHTVQGHQHTAALLFIGRAMLPTEAGIAANNAWQHSQCLHFFSRQSVPATSTAQAAFDAAMEKYGEDATVIAMPFGGATLPMCE